MSLQAAVTRFQRCPLIIRRAVRRGELFHHVGVIVHLHAVEPVRPAVAARVVDGAAYSGGWCPQQRLRDDTTDRSASTAGRSGCSPGSGCSWVRCGAERRAACPGETAAASHAARHTPLTSASAASRARPGSADSRRERPPATRRPTHSSPRSRRAHASRLPALVRADCRRTLLMTTADRQSQFASVDPLTPRCRCGEHRPFNRQNLHGTGIPYSGCGCTSDDRYRP